MNRLLPALLALLTVTACAKRKVFEGGDIEQKPGQGQEPFFFSGPKASQEKKVIFEAFYDFKVYQGKDYDEAGQRPTKEKPACSGDARLVGYDDYSTAATGVAKCTQIGMEDIDLGEFMDGEMKSFPLDEAKRRGLDTRIRRIISDGRATYSPFKPYLVGPLIQRSSEFADLKTKDEISATFQPPDGPTVSGTGTIETRVIRAGFPYKPRLHPTTFPDVVRWGMYAQGFDTMLTNRGDAKLYDIYEYHWSTRPIAILRIHIRSNVRHFEKGLLGSAGQLLFRDIVIDLDLKEFVPVSG